MSGVPKISILIPVYNMAEFIGDAVCSVLSGGFKDLEVIIVDDGSTDDTQLTVRRFVDEASSQYDPRVRWFRQDNAGKPAALNRVLRCARGEYLAILDADDQLPPNGLADRYIPVRLANDQPPELIIGGFEVFRDGEPLGQREAPSRADPGSLYRQFCFGYKTPFHLNSCLLARSLVERVGPFDVKLKRAEDQDYSLRLLAEAQSIAVVPAIVYRYRKYRSTFAERVRYRLKDLWYRPQMISKHTRGLERVAAVAIGGVYDVGKLIYEIGGAYYN